MYQITFDFTKDNKKYPFLREIRKINTMYVFFVKSTVCLRFLSRYNYPHHKIDRDVWWYYMIELSFYWSLCISQFFDVKRKDFWEMFIHHVTTIALMAFSWTCNLTRVGTLVLVIHDCADIFLEVTLTSSFFPFQKFEKQFQSDFTKKKK